MTSERAPDSPAMRAPSARPERSGYWRKRVLVCGGRYFDNLLAVRMTLDAMDGEQAIALIINGGASGADHCARVWAKERQVPCETHPASWMQDGRAAGPMRNQRMIDIGKPDAVVAFPGGRGTADMVRRAQRAGVPVYEPLTERDPLQCKADPRCSSVSEANEGIDQDTPPDDASGLNPKETAP